MDLSNWEEPPRPRFAFTDEDRDVLADVVKRQQKIWVESIWHGARTVYTGIPVQLTNRYLILQHELQYRLVLDSIVNFGLLESAETTESDRGESL